jgi:hypothetical protein
MSPSPQSPATFAAWIASLSVRGFGVLAASHAVPVQLWLRTADGAVLHFLARGTRVTLRQYAASDLTSLVLRAECDCEEHRTAGAGVRTVLRPDARPVAEVGFDGAVTLGWTGVEAGLLGIRLAADLLDDLLDELARTAVASGPGWNRPTRRGSVPSTRRHRGRHAPAGSPVSTGRDESETHALHEPA